MHALKRIWPVALSLALGLPLMAQDEAADEPGPADEGDERCPGRGVYHEVMMCSSKPQRCWLPSQSCTGKTGVCMCEAQVIGAASQ